MPVELPLKPRQVHPFAKKNTSKSSVSGATGGQKHKATNGLAALGRAAAQKDARQATKDNQVVLILLPNGKRKFVKVKDLNATKKSSGVC
jgi:hypothetical protein